MNYDNLKLKCAIANERTELKQKARRERRERQQTILFLLMLGLTTIYWGK